MNRFRAFWLGWGPGLLLAGLAGLYLYPAAWEFPMDDAYIHFVYARNLAETGRIMFNAPGEAGVGASSLAWLLLLAGAARVGIPLHLAAKALGWLALLAAGWGIYRLFRPVLRPWPALALALLVTASGHMLWFALSGMETTLFFAGGVWALVLYRDRRWAWLGLALGGLALTRPDGLALAAAVGLVELWDHRRDLRRLPRGLFQAAGLCVAVCGPWFAYLLARTGHLLPTSAIGKHTSSLLAIEEIVTRSPALAFLERIPAVAYAGAWAGYLLEFVLGGAALPGPKLTLGSGVEGAGYPVAYLAIAAWLGVLLPLLVFAIRGVRGWARAGNLGKPSNRFLAALLAWAALHNLAYALFLPIPGTASRYGTVNHLLVWLALVVGVLAVGSRWARAGGPLLRRILSAGLLLMALANTLYWNRVYDANLEHMQDVRIAAARHAIAALPAGSVIAAFDVGAIRYYAERPILDLGGLIDPQLGDVYRHAGSLDRYLAERGVDYVILPGRANTAADGWFDFATEMGLTDSDLFTIQQVAVFEIERERWLLGYLPTGNYQASVTVYRLDY